MEIKLSIKKAAVYNEVAKTTAYVGVKTGEADEKMYDHILTTDDDRSLLERFWRETCNSVTDEFKQFIVETSYPKNSQTVDDAEVYTITMNMPPAYDETLTRSIEASLHSFFINCILAKWFAITSRKDTEYYQKEAALAGEEMKRKIYYRKQPVRRLPNE